MLNVLHGVVQGIREKFAPADNLQTVPQTHNNEVNLQWDEYASNSNESKDFMQTTHGSIYRKRKLLNQEGRLLVTGDNTKRKMASFTSGTRIEPRRPISSSLRVATPRKLFHGDSVKLSFSTEDEDNDVICLGEFPSVESKNVVRKSNVSRSTDHSKVTNENKENQKQKRSSLSFPASFVSISSPVNSRPQRYGRSVYDKIFSVEHPLGVKNDWKKKSAARQSIRLDDKFRYKLLLQETIINQSVHSFSETQKFIQNLNNRGIKDPDKSKSQDAVTTKDILGGPFQGSRFMLQKMSPLRRSQLDKSSLDMVTKDTLYSNSLGKDLEDDSIKVIAEIKHPPREKNSQEIYLRTHDAYKVDWLDNLLKKYDSKAKERIKKIEQKRMESNIYRENVEKLHHLLPEQLRKQLSIKESILEETEPEVVEDFQVTSCMEEVIDKALMSKGDKIISEKFNIQIRRKDIETLLGLNWLNDEIINFYFNMIMDRSSTKSLPKVYVFNTFFYPHLSTRGYSSVKRWTRKVSLFSHDLILVPVHLEVHWCLGAIDLRRKTIKYYDSMRGNNQRCLNVLKSYLEQESLDKRKAPLDSNEYKCEIVKDVPQQMNGSDCGVFTCTYAEFLSRDRPITFTQKNMPDIRQRMIYEIIVQQLLS